MGPARPAVVIMAVPIENWQALLREKGYRLTPQRELVLKAVQTLGHATPDEVLREIRVESEAINLSTVYRNLELLEELGLVRHAHLTDRAPTYYSTSVPQHVHLVCRDCRVVIDAEPGEFATMTAELQRLHGFEADLGHLTVFGTCGECGTRGGSL